MQLALRPYVTTGVAIVGAAAIAVTPVVVTPTMTDFSIPHPSVQAERAVQLAASVEDAVNQLLFAAAEAGVRVAQLPAPVVARILGVTDQQAAAFLVVGSLGLFGPLISGPGAAGSAVQNLIDSDGLEEFLVNLIGAPGTILDGFVNGGYGPNLETLVIPALIALGEFPAMVPPALWPTVLAGGLINLQEIIPNPTNPTGLPPLQITLPGTIPTLQGLVEQLFGLLSPAQTASATSLTASSPDVEGTVNDLLFSLTSTGLEIAQLAAPLVAPILGVTNTQAAAFLTVGTLGLFGPLISGPGAVGTAIQNIVDADGLEELVTSLIGAPGTVIDGFVNGGYGPNFESIVIPALIALGEFPAMVPPALWPTVLAGGLINLQEIIPNPTNPTGLPPLQITLPGTIPTLQGLVEQLFGLLSPAAMSSTNSADLAASKLAVDPFPDADPGDVFDAVRGAAEGVLSGAEQLPAGVGLLVRAIADNPQLAPALLVRAANTQINGLEAALAPVTRALIGTLPRDLRLPVGQALGTVSTGIQDVQDAIQDAATPKPPTENKAGIQTLGNAGANQNQVEGPEVKPKKHRQRVELNVFKINPLDSNNQDGDGAAQVGGGDGTTSTAKHRPGVGLTPVRDLVKRVLGGDDNDDDGDVKAGAVDNAEQAAS